MFKKCRLPRLLLCASLSLSAAFASASDPYWFGFEISNYSAPDSTDTGGGWHSYPSTVTSEPSGTWGIPARTGNYFGVITRGGGTDTGAFTRFNGYSNQFLGGYTVSQDVYLDVNDPTCGDDTYGWDLSSSQSDSNGDFRRDYIFHTAGYANHTILVAASNNSPFHRRNDLGSLNHYTVTKSGWYTFQWVFRDVAGKIVVDCNLIDATGQKLWTESRASGDNVSTSGGNRYAWFTFLTPDHLVIDNTQILKNSSNGLPVDLNGSYHGVNSGPGAGKSGYAAAYTIPFTGIGQVFEKNGTDASPVPVRGTYTPFSAAKDPKQIVFNNLNDGGGTSFEADLEISGNWLPWHWSPATGDTFSVGFVNQDMTYGVRFSKDNSGQIVAQIGAENFTSFGVQLSNTVAQIDPGTTRVRVNASFSGGFLTASVTPLDGPDAFTTIQLGTTDGHDMDGNVGHGGPVTFTSLNTGFTAGFECHENQSSSADVKVTDFNTNRPTNAMFVFADDAYVRSLEGAGAIEYRVGQANLAQSVCGYQSFLDTAGSQAFAGGAYWGPYTDPVPSVPTIIGGYVNISANMLASTNANLTDAVLRYSPTGAGSAWLSFAGPNNLFAGSSPDFFDISANVFGSNLVLVDDTAPVLGTPTFSDAFYNGNAIQGNLKVSLDASDANGSGLDERPNGVITWHDGTKTAISTYSLIDNTFQANVPITPTTPNGPASVTFTVRDRAGNEQTVTQGFNVSTVNITVDVNETGLSHMVTRVVEFKFGGSGGNTNPVTVRKEVSFDASGHGSTVITYQDLSAASSQTIPSNAAITVLRAKDPFFSLAKQAPLSGSNGSLTASVTLALGDVTNNNVVNVSDLAVWTAFNGSNPSGSTTLNQAAIPRQVDLDGSGHVDIIDRNLILASWLATGDPDITNGFNRGGGQSGFGDGSQTVAEVARETGFSLRVVMSIDTNKDGIVTKQEVLAWRPKL